MKLYLNGEQVEVNDSCITINALLEEFKLAGKIVIVEWNQRILEKSDHETTGLSDGDRIEIVHFVGGG
ncbi:sulfur carrier protein ThiS [Paenibacillus crassostreae]|uniref:Thiamine biosynthesis protein ThiS n=1 Tax=Paenibacillus crassostreae TaxID=1763538 RepID=A0A167FS29_9BACL|nr:sulfur carrier protein ThiS [Paenibacillus crassostreae]AOZ94117.1 thiamine biosynthesis protein ThiS [Paenibacillus crassostreae]OAB76847.1 thiamine biosynthesis protein ThiS [Paenibacillus crassostreae]